MSIEPPWVDERESPNIGFTTDKNTLKTRGGAGLKVADPNWQAVAPFDTIVALHWLRRLGRRQDQDMENTKLGVTGSGLSQSDENATGGHGGGKGGLTQILRSEPC
jgi:hypothetical protein